METGGKHSIVLVSEETSGLDYSLVVVAEERILFLSYKYMVYWQVSLCDM